MRRALVSIVVLACSLPPRGLMAQAPADVLTRASALADAGRFAEAARMLRDALAEVPENEANRGQRNLLATQAINAFKLAFDADPANCGVIGEGLAVAREYVREFEDVYGAAAKSSDEYTGVVELRGELERGSALKGCSTRPEVKPVSRPGPAPDEALPTPRDSPSPSRTPLVVGLGVSAGLAATMLAVALGTGLSRAKGPVQGAAYTKIYDAAKASHDDGVDDNEVDYGEGSDMCSGANRTRNGEVAAACSQYDRLKTVAIATGVVSGVFVVSSVVFAVLLARHKRKYGQESALGQRLQIGAAPRLEGGFAVSAGLQF